MSFKYEFVTKLNKKPLNSALEIQKYQTRENLGFMSSLHLMLSCFNFLTKVKIILTFN